MALRLEARKGKPCSTPRAAGHLDGPGRTRALRANRRLREEHQDWRSMLRPAYLRQEARGRGTDDHEPYAPAPRPQRDSSTDSREVRCPLTLACSARPEATRGA